jgi:hypothetical protein
MRRLKVLQVLLQRRRVKLRQELRLGGRVEAANVVDQLTFIHEGFTFQLAGDRV